LVSLTGVSGANPVMARFKAGAEKGKTGIEGVCYRVLVFQVFNVFNRLGFMRGVEEANCA
jgi:hypothetical protein